MRWPFKKHDCITEGHRWRTEKRHGIKKGPSLGRDEEGTFHFRCMGHTVNQQRNVCRSCGEKEPWATTWGVCNQSIGLPSDMYETLDREGFVPS